MNFINRMLLRVALLPSPLYSKFGVNIKHLKLILGIKLLMDDRRPNTFHQIRQKKSDKAISAATIGTMLISAFLGFIFLVSFKVSNDLITQLIFYFSLYIILLASTLISDFTSVLIDFRDNYIILPKTVTDKTFILSKILHIFIHVTKIIFPMSLPAVVYVAVLLGYWASFVFFLMTLFATMFTIFLINIIYLLIIKITSPRKFQIIISYVQISMAIIIFGGYQLVVQMANKVIAGSLNITLGSWTWLLPSYWFALGCKFLIVFSFQPSLIVGALLSILVPFLSLWMVLKYFAPSFNQKLSLITGSSEESASSKTSYRDRHVLKSSIATKLSKLISRKGEERMGFLITWKLTGRLKDFKLKVYPSIGGLLVLVVVSFLNNKGFHLDEVKIQTGDNRIFVLSAIYASSFLLVFALGQLQFSDNFKAAWFYFITPIKKPGLIFSGAFKSMIIKFYMPFAMVISIVLILLIGFTVIPNILLGIVNVCLGSMFLSLVSFRNFPFSAMQQISQKAGTMLRTFLSMGLFISLGVLHYIIFNIPVVVIISILLSVLANWLLLDYMKNKSWAQILDTYND